MTGPRAYCGPLPAPGHRTMAEVMLQELRPRVAIAMPGTLPGGGHLACPRPANDRGTR